MGMLFARPGEVERPRVRITSVPYALKASDAETLGGLPASAYLLAPTAGDEPRRTKGADSADKSAVAAESAVAADLVLPGTTNLLAKYVNGAAGTLGNSGVFEVGGFVGLGTAAPLDRLHVRFNNINGTLTGLAVQNLGATNASYSGMLFYDQFGAVRAVPGLQQRHARIPHQQRRQQPVHQLHARRCLAVEDGRPLVPPSPDQSASSQGSAHRPTS